MILDWIKQYNFNIVGLSEVNVHWKNVPTEARLSARTYGWFEALHLSYAYNLDWPSTSPFQVGGTLLWSINTMAHRVIQHGVDPSDMGRWCWTSYRGKNGMVIRIISAYRCVENQSGASSAWSQQSLVLEKRNNDENPREVFVTDLVRELTNWIEQGDQIILGLDLNENVVSAEFTSTLSDLGLIEINVARHGTPPNSYIRGSAPIDGLYVSLSLQDCQCGYLPFQGDHRPLWIDIPYTMALGEVTLIPPRARRLKLQDPRIVAKYNQVLLGFVDKHQLVQRAQVLSLRNDTDSSSFAQEYNEVDELRTLGMQYAEHKCRKLKMGSTPFCPTYSKLWRTTLIWRLIVKMKSGQRIDSRYLSRQMALAEVDKSIIKDITLPQARVKLQSAYKLLRSFSKQAAQARSTWLEDLAEARATANDSSSESELQSLIHRENQRKHARLIKASIKPSQQYGLPLIHVSSPDGILEFTTKHDMEINLFCELKSRFHQAKYTPFASAPLLHLMGRFGTSSAAKQILAGTFCRPPEVDEWTKKLLPHLAYAPGASSVLREFQRELTTCEHLQGWSKMKETTSPGYSALSFAQFKAATRIPDLCYLDTVLADIPYRSGFSPSRWQQGLDIMLQKQPGNFNVEKLRAILLYESDFNQNNKRYGRQIMYLAEKYQSLAPEQFGSRKHMSAVDQSLNKALTFDLWRQLRIPGALCSNDAKSCYDRILHNFASICLQRLGSPIEPIVSMFSTIQSLHHHVRTIHGDSDSSFSGKDWEIPIHGVGQGNGAGPQIWAAVSTPLLNLLRSENCGALFQSSLSRSSLHFVGYAYVDDTDLVASNFKSLSGQSVVSDLQYAVDAWQGGINASGGALVPEKSHWYFIDFKWNQGKPSYKPVKDTPTPLYLNDSSGHRQTLKQLEPWEAERTLGVRIAPDGNMKIQAKHMRQVAEAWSDKIRNGQLHRSLVWQALLTTDERQRSKITFIQNKTYRKPSNLLCIAL